MSVPGRGQGGVRSAARGPWPIGAQALEACILITLYRRAGDWVPIEQIADRLGVADERARAACAELTRHAQIGHCVVEGRDLYASCVGCARGAG